MKITCFFMVCAYLSTTVSSEEIKHLHRIKKVKSWEEFVPKDDTAGKESNPTVKSYPDVRRFPPQVRVETFQKPKKVLPEIQFEPLQQKYYKRTNRPVKRLKTRSVAGTSAIAELSGNELISNLIPEVHDHGHGSIHIEPVFRVTTKSNNVFESIADILRQLLDPPKDEPGPLVGPVQVPGSGRKIYLRLLEPVDASHVMVRFVTQVQVPTVDQEAKHGPVFSGPPIIDPAAVLLNGHHHSGLSDVVYGSSSNRHHHSVQPPRNVSFARGKGRGSQSTKKPNQNSLKNPLEDLQDNKVAGSSSPNKEESSEGAQKQLSGGSGSYHFETEEEALNQVNAILGEVNATAITEPQEHQLTTHRLPLRQITPLYPLTSMTHADSSGDTYKVPSDVPTGPSSYSSSYSNSYEQYGDANTAPDFYASSYDQHYSAPSSYAASYSQQSNLHTTPTTYVTAVSYQNEFSPYPASYQNQNEFSSSTSYDKQNDLYGSYSTSYERPANVPPLSSTYETYREKPSVPTTPASHTTPYEKQSQGAQSGSGSHDALHIIDPPYFPGYPRFSEDRVNRSLGPVAAVQPQQPRYNVHSLDEAGSFAHDGESSLEKIVWGKSRRQKNERDFPKNLPEISSENGYEKWQPVVFVHENAGWHDAFKADLARATKQQSPDRSRKTSRNTSTSSPREKGTTDQRQNGKRSRGPTLRSSWCSTGEEDGCEQTKSTTASTSQVIHLEKTIQVVEKTQPTRAQPARAQPSVDIKLIPATASNLTANNTIEASTLTITSKSPTTSTTTSTTTTTTTTTTSTTTSTTKLPPLLIDTTKSLVASPVASSIIEKPLPLVQTTKTPLVDTTKTPVASPVASSMIEKPLPLLQTTRRPELSGIGTTKKLIASETRNKLVIKVEDKSIKQTKQPPVSGATKPPVSNNNARKLELPKRPVLMKKPMFIMKRLEQNSMKKSVASSTTQNPTTSSTTKSAIKFSKFRSMRARKPNTT